MKLINLAEAESRAVCMYGFGSAKYVSLASLEKCQVTDADVCISKAVHITTEDSYGWVEEFFNCPKCDILLGNRSHVEDMYYNQQSIFKNNMFPKFCPYCGQKLDWPSTKEVDKQNVRT